MKLRTQVESALAAVGAPDQTIWAWQTEPNLVRLIVSPEGNDLTHAERGQDALDAWLDQDIDPGLGCSDHPPMWAWTEDFILVEGVYDGSTWFEAIPRSPTVRPGLGGPEFIGGG